MNHLIEEAGLSDRILCDSAGTGGYHIGAPPDGRMRTAASQRGIELRGRARQFDRSDFEEFDLILAMDKDNYHDILSLDPAGKYRHKVQLMCGYCRHFDLKEVPDPYYGGPEGFNRVIDLLMDACQGLLDSIIQSQKLTISD